MNKKVALACSVCSSRNYTTTKNTRTKPERLEIKKFCKRCSTHTMHKETK